MQVSVRHAIKTLSYCMRSKKVIARFKPIHKGLKLLPVDFDRQVIPGSFEHALCHLVDHEIDLSSFHARYKNDVEGASAFDPAVLIKIILLAYVDAQAHGTGSEQALLLPVIQATAALRSADTVITADTGYHSAANLKALAEQSINAYIPDNGYRRRDERYVNQLMRFFYSIVC